MGSICATPALSPARLGKDDFEREDFFTKKYVKKMFRVQLFSSRNATSPQVLSVICPASWCLIDSCSDVSLARRVMMFNVTRAREVVLVSHLGGKTALDEFGTFSLIGGPGQSGAVSLNGVFAIDGAELPEGVVALIGVADVSVMGLSLDFILANPGCEWTSALRRPDRSPAVCGSA